MSTSALTDLLSQLVSTPSVNPAHSEDPSITGEERMAELFISLFKARGLSVEVTHPMGAGRPAVIGRSQPAAVHKTLMFEMHLDTVGIAHMTVDPFLAQIENGKLYGRGSCDMKGAMASLFHILTPERIESLNQKGIELILVGAPDEETGLGGSTRMAAEGLGADIAFVLEPTQCLPVIAHKGALWYDVELKGRSGHGSQPQSGVSTNAALSDFLPALFDIHQQLTQEYSHPLLGNSTLNIGKIEGGQTYNIIPERTLLQLDRRVIPNEPSQLFPDQVNRKIQDMITAGLLLDGRCTLTSETTSFSTSDQSPLVKDLQQAITRVTGEPAPCSGTSWVSDASPFSQTCEQILVFGPGDIAQAHTDNEFIEIAQLERAASIFADFLDHFE
ncbi:M20/M25/M40 family metallo-hydrolase [Kiritimatiellota bacterium B12222]|nr:M20/M25/M40 family metallo-hydrolase [Kiritimatiellota bacterium B12222]